MSGQYNLDGSNLGGGPFNGFSPVQTINNVRSSEQVMHRRVLRHGWNTGNATGTVNGHHRLPIERKAEA